MYQYKLPFIPTNFVIVGAGGTGSRLVPPLAQFIKNAAWIQNPNIFIIDEDIVEPKNLVRQNFIKLDLGKHKAAVLADRYGKAFDINIVPIIKTIGPYSHYSSKSYVSLSAEINKPLILDNLINCIIILCVDSMQSRKDILSHLIAKGPIMDPMGDRRLIIDAGNENDFGQVLLYNMGIPDWKASDSLHIEHNHINGGIPGDVMLNNIPLPLSFYETTKDNLKAASCADLDQTLAINASVATTIMGIVQNLLYSKPITFHRMNIDLSHGNTPQYITPKYLADFFKEKNAKLPLYGNVTKISISNAIERGILLVKNFKEKMESQGQDTKEVKKKKSKIKEDEVKNKPEGTASFIGPNPFIDLGRSTIVDALGIQYTPAPPFPEPPSLNTTEVLNIAFPTSTT